MKFRFSLLAAALVTTASPAWPQTQGVSDGEILLGTHVDLSGPAVSIGKALRNGMDMKIGEINAAGGIHSRKIRLITEDSGMDPKRSVLGTQKLVTQDKVFAIVGSLGTAQTLAAMPVALKANILHLFPIGGGKELWEPVHPLKYAWVSTTFGEFERNVPILMQQTKTSNACAIHLDDEAGLEIKRGTEAGLKAMGKQLTSSSGFKRGETDFTAPLQKLMAEKCDFVTIGALVREAIGIMTTAKRMGYSPVFLGSVAVYSDVTHKLGGDAVEGLYASMRSQQPYADDPSADVRTWFAQYKKQFGDEPSGFAIMGYTAIDLFARAATKAGKSLSNESFTKAMDSLVVPPDIFGNPEMSWTPTKRIGSEISRLSQIRNGRWIVVKDY